MSKRGGAVASAASLEGRNVSHTAANYGSIREPPGRIAGNRRDLLRRNLRVRRAGRLFRWG